MDETLLAIAEACALLAQGRETETDEWVRGARDVLAAVLGLDPLVLDARSRKDSRDIP